MFNLLSHMVRHLSIALCNLILMSPVIAYADSNLDQLISEKTEITTENTNDLAHAMTLDVLSRYNLNKLYDTELKQKKFKLTDEYKSKLAELKSEKTEILKNSYYIKLSEKNDSDVKIYNYDLSKKGVIVRTRHGYIDGSALFSLYEASNPKNSIKRVRFRNLSFKDYMDNESSSVRYRNQELFIPMSEGQGELVENNKRNIDIFIMFNIKGVSTSGVWEILEAGCPNNVLIADSNSGEVYYNKSFACTNASSKKALDKRKRK